MAIHLSPNVRRNVNRLYNMRLNRSLTICLILLVCFLFFIFLRGRSSNEVEPYDVTPPEFIKKLNTKYHNPAVTFNGNQFLIKEKKMQILSGAIHYFRTVPDHWSDRLMKLKAMGLNTVETYVSWNLHEPVPGQYDFTGILDIGRFIRLAQELGLNVIVRPGPYICSEWDNGGLPAWLLHDPNMVIRSPYKHYLEAVKRYFVELFRILTPLQTAHGGPIIAFQVENEYVAYVHNVTGPGKEYLQYLADLMRYLGVVELLVTSDGPSDIKIASEIAPYNSLLTVNFQKDIEDAFSKLLEVQPHKPLMIMEYWSGWFDHWGHPHLDRDITVTEITVTISTALKMGGSFNLYMFHGGTNFGFMNGANIVDGEYRPDVTSYDYGALLTEAGDITPKYESLRNIIQELAPNSITTPLPPIPANMPKAGYGQLLFQLLSFINSKGEVKLNLYLKLLQTTDFIPEPEISAKPIPMEYLAVNKGNGQSFGYVLYRVNIPLTANKVTVTQLRDHGVALLNGEPISKLSSFASQSFIVTQKQSTSKGKHSVLDILVENCGRVNYGNQMGDRKGINGEVLVDNDPIYNWKIYSFEFKPNYVEQVQSGGLWSRTPVLSSVGPTLFKGDFTISGSPQDTFLDMDGWTKGIVFINNVNIGRYWNIGPQQTLYIPGPLLKQGVNKLLIFEMHHPKSSYSVNFRDSPILNKIVNIRN